MKTQRYQTRLAPSAVWPEAGTQLAAPISILPNDDAGAPRGPRQRQKRGNAGRRQLNRAGPAIRGQESKRPITVPTGLPGFTLVKRRLDLDARPDLRQQIGHHAISPLRAGRKFLQKTRPGTFTPFGVLSLKKHPVTFSNIPCIIKVAEVADLGSQKRKSLRQKARTATLN